MSKTVIKEDFIIERTIVDLADPIPVQLRDQISRVWLKMVLGFLFAVAGIIAVLSVSITVDRPVMNLMRDPAAVSGVNPFIGFLSNIGLMFWSATVAICLFGSVLLFNRNTMPRLARFLLLSGLFTLMLLFDDAFLLHEKVFPEYLHLLQYQTYSVYALIVLGLFFYFYRTILSTDFIPLFLAMFFLAAGALVEYRFGFGNIQVFVEDSFKFLGIVFWLVYFSHTVARAIQGDSILRSDE